jgi:hypothetical protein
LVQPARYNEGDALLSPSSSLEWNPAVLPLDLWPDAGLRLDGLVVTPSTAVALLVSTFVTAACPRCGTPSDRLHSRYRRSVADLACHDQPGARRLVVRRFRCIDPGCPQGIF